MQEDYLLIGVDGGATKVSAWQVLVNTEDQSFKLGETNVQRSYRDIPGFINDYKPVSLPDQLKDMNAAKPALFDDEIQQADVYIEACAQVLEELATKDGPQKILVGLGMPGLKTSDMRGIAVVANGPRMFNYADKLEKRLALKNVSFIVPIHQLGSDADYCGIGENYSIGGKFKDVQNAYYLGGGTGVADAMKLHGELLPFDQAKLWISKSWEMKQTDGRSLERFVSASGIQSIFADLSGVNAEQLNKKQIYPLQIAQMAKDGQETAQKAFNLVNQALINLIMERITTLYCGWHNTFEFVNPNKPALESQHNFLGTCFDRIIFGQRLGELFLSDQGKSVIYQPVLEGLHQAIADSKHLDQQAKTHYAALDNIFTVSQLREAPVVGAGIDAYLNFKKVS